MGRKNKMSFEESLEKLEKCAAELRSGEAGLEEAVELYNKSLEYYKQCQEILADAKQKIEMVDPNTGEVVDFND